MTREDFLDRIDEIMCGTSNAERAYLADLYNEVVAPHWISVKDELPPRGRTDPNVSVPVITCKIVNRELHEIGFQQYIFGKGKWKYCDATHWMPLPSVELKKERREA